MHVIFIVLSGLVILLPASAWAQERPRKKLIEYGWDVPYPEFVQEHIREMELRPFDGIIFRLRDFNHAFDTRRWDEVTLRSQFDALANIDWETFTDNFLCLYAANHWGMDWFNDAQWETITSNLRLTSRAAKIGRCVGICFDPEPYGPNPWGYPGIYKDKTFTEVANQVRRRGAQFITALQQELPHLRLLTFFQLSIFGNLVDEPDPKRREERLTMHDYALLPAFLNGILDAAAPGVRIIDGNEGAYYYTDADAYFRAYHLMKQRALAFIVPENRDKYVSQVHAGMALYMDQLLALRLPEGGFLSYYLSPQERMRWLEHNVYYALISTDEYVWCYSERMSWWENRVPEGAEESIRSAREKVAHGKPLGFDLTDIIKKARERMDAAIASRLIRRTANVQPLPTGEQPPKIDGELDDGVWQRLKPLEPFLPNAASLKDKIDAQTISWVTYDDRALYIAFRCLEPKVEDLKVVGERDDDDIWMGDVVEVLVSLGEEPRPYHHFIVNPKNLRWDGESAEEGDDKSWDTSWQSSVRIGKGEWAVEIAIPWEALGGRPRAGDKRRANLCRQRTPVYELSTWSAVVHGFLEADRFGIWEFSE